MRESTRQVCEGGVVENVAKVAKQVATPSPAYPVRAVGKHAEIVRVPSAPRAEWGLSEDLLAVGLLVELAGGVQ